VERLLEITGNKRITAASLEIGQVFDPENDTDGARW
jgi:hypothetical protein